VDVALLHSRKLAEIRSEVFDVVGQFLKPFESCVGVNGKVYIKSGDGSPLRASLVGNIITKSYNLNTEELTELCQDAERRLNQ
jgi:hypothetical protein